MKLLLPHQNKALEFLENRTACPIFMSMRLGKNLTIIRHLQAKGLNLHDFKILFVTTVGAMNSIQTELISEGEQVTTLRGTKPQRLKILGGYSKGWLVVNYESVAIYKLHSIDWKVVILDESIKIANPKSTITKYFLSSAWQKVKYRYALNGAPNPDKDDQIVSQFLFTNRVFMNCTNFWQYRNTYHTQTTAWDWEPIPGHKKNMIDYVHKNAFVLDRSNTNIGSSKEYQKRYVPQNDAQVRSSSELMKNYEINGVQYMNEMGVGIGLQYIAGGMLPANEGDAILISDYKLKELIHIVKNNFGEKILIWCKFLAEQKAICKALQKEGLLFIKINGSHSSAERVDIKANFDKSKDFNVAVLTIASCAKGQDWSRANTSIYYSNEWSNDLRIQSEERMIHVQKKEPVLIIDLLTENSIDIQINKAIKDKTFNVKQVMTDFIASLHISKK